MRNVPEEFNNSFRTMPCTLKNRGKAWLTYIHDRTGCGLHYMRSSACTYIILYRRKQVHKKICQWSVGPCRGMHGHARYARIYSIEASKLKLTSPLQTAQRSFPPIHSVINFQSLSTSIDGSALIFSTNFFACSGIPLCIIIIIIRMFTLV